MADQEQVILDVMKKLGKPMKAGDIAEVVGIDKEAVSKTIKDLKKKGLAGLQVKSLILVEMSLPMLI